MSKSAIEQGRAEIKELMKKKEWGKAHRMCLEMLRYDPDNIKFIRLKNKIEKKVKKINIRAIKQDLKTLTPLWKEERYQELLEHLKKLEPYIGQYPPLAKVIVEAQEAYRKQILQKERNYERDTMKNVGELRREKKYQEALEIMNNLAATKVQEESLKSLQQSLRKEWVNDELQKNKELLKSNKSKEKMEFLQKLQAIDPQSQRVKLQLMLSRGEHERSESKEQRAIIEEAFQKVQTLFKEKKYDEASNAAEELLKLIPKNTRAQKLTRKIQKKVQRSTQKEVMQQMKKAHQNIKKTPRKERKEGYIKM